MIEVSRLTKWYGQAPAVRDISFEVARGEVVGFLGPNGAGKSTTLRILAGFLAPTSGVAKIDGICVQREPRRAQRLLGYMPEACPFYTEMRVQEYLRYRAEIKGVPRSKRPSSIDRAMQRAGVFERRGALIGHLSKGYRQRLGLADALVSEPPLLILDEPTAGLDPNQIRQVRRLIRELKQSHTVLLSTHILAEVEMVCDRALVLHRGRLVAQGSIDELRNQRRATQGVLLLSSEKERNWGELEQDSAELSTLVSSRTLGEQREWKVQLGEHAPGLADWIEWLLARDVRVHQARPLEARLEDVFAELTESTESD